MSNVNSKDDDFDEADLAALDVLEADAIGLKEKAEATAKAFGAMEELVEVCQRITARRVAIDHPEHLLAQLSRLRQTMEDWYAPVSQ